MDPHSDSKGDRETAVITNVCRAVPRLAVLNPALCLPGDSWPRLQTLLAVITWVCGCPTGIEWVEARDVAKQLMRHRTAPPTTKNCPRPNVNNAELRNLALGKIER